METFRDFESLLPMWFDTHISINEQPRTAENHLMKFTGHEDRTF